MNFRRPITLLLAGALSLAGCAANGGSGGTAAAGSASPTTTQAAVAPKSDPATLASIHKLVEERLGRTGGGDDGVKVIDVRPMPMMGLYEVVTSDKKLIYTDEHVNYVISGHIYDLNNMSDLTGERLEQITAIPLDTLPLEIAIKTVKGNGKRRIAVFSDTDCPFCRKFETEMSNVTDVTIYTFLYPIAQLHPEAPEHTRRIWCAPDRLKAWNDYWNADVVPAARACNTDGLDRILKLGAEHHINGTPTLVFADGHVIPGAMPAAMLEKHLGAR